MQIACDDSRALAEAMQKSLNLLREAAKNEDEIMELLYFDETGVCNVSNVQRGWSPLSKAHRADASIGRKRVNVLGALNYAAGMLAFEVHEHMRLPPRCVELSGQASPQLGTRKAHRGGIGQREHSLSHRPQNAGRVDGARLLHPAVSAAVQP